jgi:hypothetical protein
LTALGGPNANLGLASLARLLFVFTGIAALLLLLLVASSLARDGGSHRIGGQCGHRAAEAILAKQSGGKRGKRSQARKAGAVLCGAFAGRHSRVMVIALRAKRCKLDRGWLAFRQAKGRWVRIFRYKRMLTGLAKRGRRIKETTFAKRSQGKNCNYSGSKWRLWRWTGRKLAPGAWHNAHDGEKGAKLVVTPKEATVTAGQSFHLTATYYEDGVGRDVTGKLTYLYLSPSWEYSLLGRGSRNGESHPASPDDCKQQLWREQCGGTSEDCAARGLAGSCCDLHAASCRTIWPGDWLVWAYYKDGGLVGPAFSFVHVRADETLSVSPSNLPPYDGSDYSVQLSAGGRFEGSLTWEFYEPTGPPRQMVFDNDAGRAIPDIGGFQLHDADAGLITRQAECSDHPGSVAFVVRVRDDYGHSGVKDYGIDVQSGGCEP